MIHVEADGFAEHRRSATVRDVSHSVDIVLDVAAVREEVTVTAAPGYAQDAARAVQPVSVISREDIDRRVSRFVAEAVQEEPGVHLQNTSPTMSGVFVRGLTGNKVNVFVDGVRYSNGAQRGGVNTFLNLIDPSVVDGIEIVHGPNSAEYGSDALGGTIQFLTRTPALAASGTRVGGEVALGGQTGHQGGGGNAALSFGTTHLRHVCLGRRPQGRRNPDRRRHRFARRGHAVPRRAVRRCDGRAAAQHRFPAVRRHGESELDAEQPHADRVGLHRHAAGQGAIATTRSWAATAT